MFLLIFAIETKKSQNYAELSHIKWIFSSNEHNTGLWYRRVTNRGYTVMFSYIKCKNKTVNTIVYNKNKYYLNCYMFKRGTINKMQENLYFSGRRVNQRTVRLLMYTLYTVITLRDVHPVQHPHTSWRTPCNPPSHCFGACNKYMAALHSCEDKPKFWKSEWEFGFITGNSERENRLFPFGNSKHAFLFSG